MDGRGLTQNTMWLLHQGLTLQQKIFEFCAIANQLVFSLVFDFWLFFWPIGEV